MPVRQQDVRLCSHQRRVQNLLRCWPSCQVNLVMFQSCTHWLSVLLKCTFYPSQNIVSMGTVIRRQIHCKLCLGMNNINYDLLKNLTTDSSCDCGERKETSEHSMLHCPCYTHVPQNTVFRLLADLLNISTLLQGAPNVSSNRNSLIFKAVQDFIAQSGHLQEDSLSLDF